MLGDESPKDQKKHLQHFARYERFWRRVLIDVLEWSEHDFALFVAGSKEDLESRGGFSFFRDAAHKYASRGLLPKELQKEFQGGDAIFSGYLLMKTLAGDWSKISAICNSAFDIEASRLRYQKLCRRLLRIAEHRRTLKK